MFKTEEEAIKYLQNAQKVVIPEMFTYFCHSSQVQTQNDEASNASYKFKKLWQKLPLNGFNIKGEMSFLAKRDRMRYVQEAKSFDAAPIAYAGVPGQKGFQIKVMMPRNNLTNEEYAQMGKDEDYLRKLRYEYRGLGDGRHPKLPGKTEIVTFGFMDHDEMSGKEIPTVIGCRKQDVIAYANAVEKEIKELESYGQLIDSKMELPDESYVEERETFVMGDNLFTKEIEKDVDFETQHKEEDPKVEKNDNPQETKPQEEEVQEDKPKGLDELKELIAVEYDKWKDKNDGRFETIDEHMQSLDQTTSPYFYDSDIRLQGGKVEYHKPDSAMGQRRLLTQMERKKEALTQTILGDIRSQHGNYLQYATWDYCRLEKLEGVLPSARQRLDDLELYEKNIGEFKTQTTEEKKVKKPGIIGLFGAVQTERTTRKLSCSEMLDRKTGATQRLLEVYSTGCIDEQEYNNSLDAIERLYEGLVPEKISQEEISVAKEAAGLTEQNSIQIESQKKQIGASLSLAQRHDVVEKE